MLHVHNMHVHNIVHVHRWQGEGRAPSRRPERFPIRVGSTGTLSVEEDEPWPKLRTSVHAMGQAEGRASTPWAKARGERPRLGLLIEAAPPALKGRGGLSQQRSEEPRTSGAEPAAERGAEDEWR